MTICVIPARLASTRYPRKVLAQLGDKPLLKRVWDAAHATKRFSAIYFAVDALETAALIDSFGGKWVMTDPNCATGTERLIDFMRKSGLTADVWVNWQADEPFITPAMIDALLTPFDAISTLRKRLTDEPADDPNTVKVVVDENDRALYFSRYAIPYMRSREVPLYKHIGIYAFTKTALETIATMQPCPLEEAESLEQLRFLYRGLSICVRETDQETIGIDHPDDMVRALAFISR